MSEPHPVVIDRLEQLSAGKHSEYLYKLSDGEGCAVVKVSRRRRKTLGLQVDQEIAELKVPTNCPWDEIHTFLVDHFEWILEAKDEMANRPPIVRDCFQSGGEVSYLGERYRLDVVKSWIPVVTIDGSDLYVSCTNPGSARQVERQVMGWLRRQAEEIFAERVKGINERFPDECQPSGVRIRKMRSRWGSCSSSGEVCFNLMLIREYLPQIDFVVAHELCHLRHFAHNPSFYRLLDQVIPDWRDREQLLKC